MSFCRSLWTITGVVSLTAFLASCGFSNTGKYYDRDGPPILGGELRSMTASSVDVKVEKPNKWANRPYTVMGKRYYPVTGDKPMTQVGTASWYGKQFHGKKTSTGEIYDMYELSAAHKTMELPSYAKVTNLKNGRSIIVRVNDRGPFLHGRIIDLSYAAAVKLGYQKEGTARVKVERITRKDIAAGRVPSTSTLGAVLAAVASGLKSDSDKKDAAPARSQTQTKTASSQPRSTQAQAPKTNSNPVQMVSRETIQPKSTPAETRVDSVVEVDSAVLNDVEASSNESVPSVSLSFAVEETTTQGQALDLNDAAPSRSAPQETSGSSTTSDDAIAAILAAENAQVQTPDTPAEASSDASNEVPPVGWKVQLGAYSQQDNARAAAAHAETLLDQDNLGPVGVAHVAGVYKVWAGQASSHQDAVELAEKISAKLGFKTIAVEFKSQ